VVFAGDEEGAVIAASELVDQLCADDCPFDYCTTFDGPRDEVSGKVRWEDLPVAVLADSDEGKRWIQWGMDATREEILEYVKKLRTLIKKDSDEELFQELDELDGFHGAFRHNCEKFGQTRGTHFWLYASNHEDDAVGIVTPQDSERVLSGAFASSEQEDQTNRNKSLKVWVVPADVHY
jgi:hypothetical protein